MRMILVLILAWFLQLLSGCSNSHIITYWKSANVGRQYNKIMVIGIIKDSGIALRSQMEKHLVNDLKSIGYNTVSALEEFGEGGLAGLEQEKTYIKLCDKGIDAIMTIALLDQKKEKHFVPERVRYYSSLYYYNRIWNYNSIQADLSTINVAQEETSQYLWETILFDLQTLSPVYAVQIKTYQPANLQIMAHLYGKMILESLLKSKILRRNKLMVAETVSAR